MWLRGGVWIPTHQACVGSWVGGCVGGWVGLWLCAMWVAHHGFLLSRPLPNVALASFSMWNVAQCRSAPASLPCKPGSEQAAAQCCPRLFQHVEQRTMQERSSQPAPGQPHPASWHGASSPLGGGTRRRADRAVHLRDVLDHLMPHRVPGDKDMSQRADAVGRHRRR